MRRFAQESTDPRIDVFDREAEWVDKVLRHLVSYARIKRFLAAECTRRQHV